MRVIPLLAATLLAACSSAGVENGALSGIARFAGDSSIDSKVEFQNERIEYAPSELAVYQVDLRNRTQNSVRCEYRVRWFDHDGMMVGDATRSWVPVHITGRSHYPVRVTARSLDAVHCEIEVRSTD